MIAGAIIGFERQVSSKPIVIGVTSASCIWILAAIGTNHHITGVKLSILAVLILTGVDTAEKKIKFLGKGMHKKYVKEQN